MTTFNNPLSELSVERLESLVDGGLSEGRQLDFKERLPGNADSDRREFAADVASFSNAAGGDLIFGVAERRDGDGRPTGTGEIVGLEDFNFDQVRLRLESTIRTGIEPRLPVQFAEISRGAEPSCLVIRISKSWSGLYMVTAGGMNRFYGRNSAGRYLLDVREIERGFLTGATARDHARSFRNERIATIVASDTPVPVGGEQKLILHVVPLDRDQQVWTRFKAGNGQAVATAMREAIIAPLHGYSSFGSGKTFNLDGFVVYTSISGARYAAYTQLFRDGAIEVVLLDALDSRQSYKGPVFSGSAVEHCIIVAVREIQKTWRQLGIAGPVMIGITLTGLRGAGIALDQDVHGLPGTLLNRDPFILPEIEVEDLEIAPEAVLRPLFDLLWNAGGIAQSPNYQGGTWKRR